MKNAYHTALRKSSYLFFEVDLSADQLKIHSCRVEGVWEQRDLPYSEIVSCSAKKCAPQFQEAFTKTFSLEYIWNAIKKSIPSVCFEYEAAVKEEERWYSVTLVPVFTGDKAVLYGKRHHRAETAADQAEDVGYAGWIYGAL